MSSRASFEPFAVELAGRNVVTASAGTGKTYAITTLVVRLVVERGLDIRRILVVTFTEAATAELRSRIRLRLREAVLAYRLAHDGGSGDQELDRYVAGRGATRAVDLARLELATENVDDAAISTIHGFCQRMLHDSAFESNAEYEAELVTDTGPLRDQVLKDAWATLVADQPQEILEKVRARGLVPSGLRVLADKVARNPDIPVLTSDRETIARHLVEEARALWQADRPRIEELFRDLLRDGPKTGSTVTKWFREVDDYLRMPEAHREKPPTGLYRFCGDGAKFVGGRPPHPFFSWCERLRYLNKSPETAFDAELLELEKRIADYIRTEIPRRKREQGVLSFDDLLTGLRAALEGPNGARLAEIIRGQYESALIDEFQDTDPVQFGIFDAVYGQTELPVFLIGDPKQAIYSFRGADVFAYFEAVSRKGQRHHTMGVNWRSDPGLVRAVNALFTERPSHPPAFLLSSIDYPRVVAKKGARDVFEAKGVFCRQPFEILFARRGDGESEIKKARYKEGLPALIAAEVSALLRSGSMLDGVPVSAGDIAILCRTNVQCFEIQDALRLLNVPAVVLGDKSVFESQEASELQQILGAVVEPTRALLRKALATELLAVSANALARMEVEPAEWDTWAGRFREWNRIWVEKGFVQMLDALVSDAAMPERLLRLMDGDRRMTNLLHLMELLRTAAKESHLGPSGLLHWLADQRSDAKKQAEHAEIRLESDEAAVKLTTIHKSKGLEYPVVYCPYLWDGMGLHSNDKKALRFHDAADRNRIKLDLGSADYHAHLEQAELETLAENVRLLYVALTRAKHRISIVWGGFADADKSALFSLLHPPALAEGEPVSFRQFEKRLGEVDDLAMLRVLAERALAAGGSIGVRELDPDAVGVPVPPSVRADAVLRLREAAREFRGKWRMTSFSGLTSGKASRSSEPTSPAPQTEPAEGRDHDEAALSEAALAPSSPGVAPVVLAAFARGANAGTFYHSVLEHLDFRDSSHIEPLVREKLAEAGYDVDPWAPIIARSVSDVLDTPLFDGHGFRLGDVPTERRLNELEFHLPVADGRRDAGHANPVTQQALARAFREHPSPEVPADYADHVARLRFLPVEGFLKGYIDLVLEHEGRFYVVDYKTNFLGPTGAAYATPKLASAMTHGHYFLQYHLYALAVHRYLERRVPSYTYETHFGGALYLFVRGMSPLLGPSHGVFFEKPPRGRLDALSHLLDGLREGAA
ncbi:MAG TPA: exodeoxyribonuclease V subunit beta [Polyangiaceae bacterium]